MIRERENCRVEWIGEEPRLVFQASVRVEGSWLPARNGRVQTQVWPRETNEMRLILLDRLLDRIEPATRDATIVDGEAVLPGGEDLFERLQWFGPEMAEEY